MKLEVAYDTILDGFLGEQDISDNINVVTHVLVQTGTICRLSAWVSLFHMCTLWGPRGDRPNHNLNFVSYIKKLRMQSKESWAWELLTATSSNITNKSQIWYKRVGATWATHGLYNHLFIAEINVFNTCSSKNGITSSLDSVNKEPFFNTYMYFSSKCFLSTYYALASFWALGYWGTCWMKLWLS